MFDRFWGRGRIFETREAVTYLLNSYTFLGVNPTDRFKALYYLYSAILNGCCCIMAPIVFNLTYFLESDAMTMSQLLTSLQAALNVWGIPIKIFAVAFYLPRLRSGEKFMSYLDSRCRHPQELAKLRHIVMMGNRCVVLFGIVYAFYELSTVVSALVVPRPPYSLYIPYLDWRNSTAEFCVQVAIETMLVAFLLYHQVVNDCYGVIYIYILRTHIQLLVERVRNLATKTEENKDANYDDLILCIVDHQNILDLLDTVSPVISVTIFTQFLITAIILCTTMINIFIFANTSEKIGSAFYFLAVLVQTFPCCYQATWLMEDSDQLPLAIFQCNWMQQDKRFRIMLIFFMQRAQQTMTLTAMKLFPINLNTNLNIAKFSFSLYTLIKEMDFGKNL